MTTKQRTYPPSRYQSVRHAEYPVYLSVNHKYFERGLQNKDVPGVPERRCSKERFDPRLTNYANYLVLCHEISN
jgi:hypothetical protein